MKMAYETWALMLREFAPQTQSIFSATEPCLSIPWHNSRKKLNCTTNRESIVKWLRLEKPIPTRPTNHIPQCRISTFLEHLQGQWLCHLSGQPVPNTLLLFLRINFLDIWPEPPMVPNKSITSHPIPNSMRKGADHHLRISKYEP